MSTALQEATINTLDRLKPGGVGVIAQFLDEQLALKLMDMGVLPGVKITVLHQAPLGCPMSLQVGDYQLSIRKEEAATIVLA